MLVGGSRCSVGSYFEPHFLAPHRRLLLYVMGDDVLLEPCAPALASPLADGNFLF